MSVLSSVLAPHWKPSRSRRCSGTDQMCYLALQFAVAVASQRCSAENTTSEALLSMTAVIYTLERRLWQCAL